MDSKAKARTTAVSVGGSTVALILGMLGSPWLAVALIPIVVGAAVMFAKPDLVVGKKIFGVRLFLPSQPPPIIGVVIHEVPNGRNLLVQNTGGPATFRASMRVIQTEPMVALPPIPHTLWWEQHKSIEADIGTDCADEVRIGGWEMIRGPALSMPVSLYHYDPNVSGAAPFWTHDFFGGTLATVVVTITSEPPSVEPIWQRRMVFDGMELRWAGELPDGLVPKDRI